MISPNMAWSAIVLFVATLSFLFYLLSRRLYYLNQVDALLHADPSLLIAQLQADGRTPERMYLKSNKFFAKRSLQPTEYYHTSRGP